jgi:rhamnosyl/mannosyltransferase
MKILQIGKFYPPYYYGGIETLSKNLHEGLRKRDVDADFLGFLPKSYKEDIEADRHIYLCRTNIDMFSTQFSTSFVKRWRRVKDEYDVVLVSMPHPFANIVLELFPPKKAKIVLWWHSDIIKQKFILQFYKPLLVSLIKMSSAVVAPTNAHIDESDFSEYFTWKKKIIPYPV